jgi:CubicO group peptidase (beta-lactamase class C family)
MKLKQRVLICLCAFWLSIINSSAFELASETIDSCRVYAEHIKSKSHIPGMQVCIVHNGSILWNKCFGYSDLSNKKRILPYTKLRIASLSKVLTSASIIKLCGMKKINLDSSVNAYISNFPRKKYPILIKNLLDHSSGIRHYIGNEFNNPKKYSSIFEALNYFKNDTLLFEPGTKSVYSSYGYNLLGAIIEKVSKESYADFVYKTFLLPFGLKQTTPDKFKGNILNRSVFYYLDKDSVIRECQDVDLAYKLPTGGYLSTAGDMAMFCSNLITDKSLNPAELNLYLEPTYYKDKKPTSWSLGWRISKLSKKHSVYWHLGSTFGASSAIAFEPKEKIVVCWITNMNINWSEEPIVRMMKYLLKIKDKE